MSNLGVTIGIKAFGKTFIPYVISSQNDFDTYNKFDYICNVEETNSYNGNGTLSINIYNKEGVEGLKIEGWTLRKGKISYCWGYSDSYITLADPHGELINGGDIHVESRRWINKENVIFLTKAIFPAAINIVKEYPSAKAFNAVLCFLETPLRWSSRKEGEGPDATLKLFNEETENLNKYAKLYKDTIQILLSSNDSFKTNALIKKVNTEFKKVCDSKIDSLQENGSDVPFSKELIEKLQATIEKLTHELK